MSRGPGACGFDAALRRFGLAPDGAAIVRPHAALRPVRQRGRAAMLKLSAGEEARTEAAALAWWNGDGSAHLLAQAGNALLLERAQGSRSLAGMARASRDDEAARILCAVAARLHAPRLRPRPDLPPLGAWFADLAPAAAAHGGLLARSAAAAAQLLATPRDIVVLHGDLHHGNVLDFGTRGWLAIDPKGLIGERGFEFAAIFTNPDLADPTQPVGTRPERFARRLDVIAAAGVLDRQRLLHWILAWTGLSAVWLLADRRPADIPRAVAELAAAELDR